MSSVVLRICYESGLWRCLRYKAATQMRYRTVRYSVNDRLCCVLSTSTENRSCRRLIFFRVLPKTGLVGKETASRQDILHIQQQRVFAQLYVHIVGCKPGSRQVPTARQPRSMRRCPTGNRMKICSKNTHAHAARNHNPPTYLPHPSCEEDNDTKNEARQQ